MLGKVITASAVPATEQGCIRAGAWRISMLPQLVVICPVQDTQDALLCARVLSQLLLLHNLIIILDAPTVLQFVLAH